MKDTWSRMRGLLSDAMEAGHGLLADSIASDLADEVDSLTARLADAERRITDLEGELAVAWGDCDGPSPCRACARCYDAAHTALAEAEAREERLREMVGAIPALVSAAQAIRVQTARRATALLDAPCDGTALREAIEAAIADAETIRQAHEALDALDAKREIQSETKRSTSDQRIQLLEAVRRAPDMERGASVLLSVLQDLDNAEAELEVVRAAGYFMLAVCKNPELTCIYCHQPGCERELRFRNRAQTVFHGLHSRCVPEMGDNLVSIKYVADAIAEGANEQRAVWPKLVPPSRRDELARDFVKRRG